MARTTRKQTPQQKPKQRQEAETPPAIATEHLRLELIPEETLQAELLRREKLRAEAAAKAREAHRELVADHVDVLLLFQPGHTRKDCSDNNICWASDPAYRCKRCDLLQIKQGGVNHELMLELHMEYRAD